MILKISLRINYLYYPDIENTNMSIKNVWPLTSPNTQVDRYIQITKCLLFSNTYNGKQDLFYL